jgi:nitroreductase
MNVVDAVMSRHSTRSFLDTTPDLKTVTQILEIAARAPSQGNTQPWKVRVLTGKTKQQLSASIIDELVLNPKSKRTGAYEYYPLERFSPWVERRDHVGQQLYESLGIARRDVDSRRQQMNKNYDFFGAPIGLIFSIDSRMQQGSWLDYGMYLQSVMLLAKEYNLDTCPIGAFILFEDLVAKHCKFEPTETIVCGMALGYQDAEKSENQFLTERDTQFIKFLD